MRGCVVRPMIKVLISKTDFIECSKGVSICDSRMNSISSVGLHLLFDSNCKDKGIGLDMLSGWQYLVNVLWLNFADL